MSNKAPKITLLGSNSGRNAGDAAILAAIMGAITKKLGPDVQFEVPTPNPRFVESNYRGQFNVKAINVMPWTGSVRFLGIPTFRSVKSSDLTFITDGIIFDVNLWNPLFNFLITLVVLVPWAKLCGKKVVCYNVGIGPLTSYFGRLFAKWVGDACDLLMVRDQDSYDLFRKIGVKKEIHLTADAVFQNWEAESSRVEEILKEFELTEVAAQNKLLGVNVTTYVDRWLEANQKVSSKEAFLKMLAGALVELKIKKDITSLIFITQVMDTTFGEQLQELVAAGYREKTGKDWKPKLISNKTYSNHELQGLAKRFKLFLGMRVHSIILNAQAGTPVVGLVYAPKVRSFIKLFGTPELALELAELDSAKLAASLEGAWSESEKVRETQQNIVSQLQKRAERAAEIICERYYPERSAANAAKQQTINA